MKSKIVIGVALFLIALMPGAGAAPAAQATPGTTGQIDEPSQASILQSYASLPLLFIQNQGQMDSQVQYYVKTSGQTIYLTPSGMTFDLVRHNTEADLTDRLAFSLDLVNASTSPLIEGLDKDIAVVNYLIGNDPQKWHTNIATYRQVVYDNVYPGIDLRLYGKAGSLEYEFVVQPGADVSDIALAYDGVESLGMESGQLVASTAFGELNQSQPYIYQQIGDDTVAVDGGFRLLTSNSYGFQVGDYDAGYPLVIDPNLSLAYSTYLGGSGSDEGHGIAVESGYAYVMGDTLSTDFPTHSWYQTDQTGLDVFVAKIDATQSGGASLIYSTYLGGSGADYGTGIDVKSGDAFVTGYTGSTDFPVQNECLADPGDALEDAFVTRLNNTGNNIIYSTYLGGGSMDFGYSIAVESAYAYVTGGTDSADFPTVNEYKPDQTGTDAFVAKIDTDASGGSSLIYSTYLGGSDNETGRGIAVQSGYAYVTGETASTDFPILNQYQPYQEGQDAFVTMLNTAGDNITYSTYLGGSMEDEGRGIAVESGYTYVTGDTYSSNFPTVNQYQTNPGVGWDAFVARLDTDQSGTNSLNYSTYLGGNGNSYGFGIAVESGCAYVTGYTDSTNFPTLNQYQYQRTSLDAFVTNIDTFSSGDASLVYSTYLGGNGNDSGYGIAVESGCAYVTGYTDSTNFPTKNQYQTDQTGRDAFVTKFNAPATDKCGIWRGSTRYFYLDADGDGIYDGATTERFGTFLSSTDTSDRPLAGDLDSDTFDEIGIWRGATRYFYIDFNDNGIYDGAATERMGPFLSSTVANDIPVAGDWDNDYHAEIGIWRGSTRYFYLDMDEDGIYDGAATERFGPFLSSTDSKDIPVSGDWDGDSFDEIGIWRGSTRYFYLDIDGDYIYDGATTERFGPFLSSTVTNDIPVAGDWDADGYDDIGIWRGSTRYFYLDMDGDFTYDGAATERFGPFLSSTVANDRPVAGNWDGL